MKKVLVPLAQGCEELEAVTIIDLLRRAEIQVTSASLDDQPVKGSRGVIILADAVLESLQHEHFDMIVLPGGLPGTNHLNNDSRIQRLLQRMHSDGRYIAAICAAPKVLANLGILNGLRSTSYPGVLNITQYPKIVLDERSAVVQDGCIITSRGPGTAMDFSLTLIEVLVGKEKRQQVEQCLARA